MKLLDKFAHDVATETIRGFRERVNMITLFTGYIPPSSIYRITASAVDEVIRSMIYSQMREEGVYEANR